MDHHFVHESVAHGDLIACYIPIGFQTGDNSGYVFSNIYVFKI